MNSMPKTNTSAQLQDATKQGCNSPGIGREQIPTLANAMERMMRKVWSIIG